MFVDFIAGHRIEVENGGHHRRPYRVRIDGDLLMAARKRGAPYPLMFSSQRAALQRARAHCAGVVKAPAKPTRMQLESALAVLEVRRRDVAAMPSPTMRAFGDDLECVANWLRHIAQGAK